VDEFELIEKYFVRANEGSGVALGIGDDGAVLRPDPDRDLVAVVDTLVAGVHYPAATDAYDVGYRSVVINLSDIAAMGARPRWMTLALSMPSADEEWVAGFADGLHAAAAEYGVALVGGDTTSGDQVVVSVQITGDVAAGAAIRRGGARVGDTIFVTGTVGDAAAGLESMSAGNPNEALMARFLRPTPRVDYGMSLVGSASAAIDISDGLYGDLQKLLCASAVGAILELELLPISAALRSVFDADAVRRFALSGGDDYELCFTARDSELPDSGDLRVTAIGKVTREKDIVCREHGAVVEYGNGGYRHFQ